jgi:hypothetical protein
MLDVLREAVERNQMLSLYQGIGTKNVQSFVSHFIFFYGFSFFKKLYLKRIGEKRMGTGANLVVAAVAGACTCLITQV